MKTLKMKKFLESIQSADSITVGTIKKAFVACFESDGGTMKIDWNKYKDPVMRGGLKIMQIINKAGYESYAVGGIARDMIMGKASDDFDIATNMPTEMVMKMFSQAPFTAKDVQGAQFGVVVVTYLRENYEIANFRKESGYSDSRHPDEVTMVDNFEEDSKRRDLTINSMGIDASGNIVDHWGGSEDIQKGIIKSVGEPEERFSEDPLRILRAIRFAARFGFNIEPKTMNAIKKLKDSLVSDDNPLPVERIKQELVKTIKHGGKKFGGALKVLKESGIFELIMPEVELTDDKIDAVVTADSNDTKVNFAILLKSKSKEDVIKFGKRFRLENDEIEASIFVNDHMKVYHMLDKVDKEKALKLVVNKYFPVLRKVHLGFNKSDVPYIDETIDKIVSFQKVKNREKEITDILQKKNIPQSKLFGDLKKAGTSWLFKQFSEGKEPSSEDLENKISELMEGNK